MTLVLLMWPALTFSAPAPSPLGPPVFESAMVQWDHHWFIWLPEHPEFESVEIAESPGPDPTQAIVWVFFTERAGGKLQVHYFNDEGLAAAFAGAFGSNRSFFRNINITRTGDKGMGQSLEVSLINRDEAPVEITVDLANRALSPRGLIAQSGHAAEILFTLLYIEEGAFGTNNQVTIGEDDFSYNSNDGIENPPPFMSAYGRNFVSAPLFFTSITYTRVDDTLIGSNRTIFQEEPGQSGVISSASFFDRREYIWDGPILKNYTHSLPGRSSMSIEFRRGINFDRKWDLSEFNISINESSGLIEGYVLMKRLRQNRWKLVMWPVEPEWASRQPFEITVDRDEDGSYLVNSKSLASILP